jgi:hypothetical protein
MAVMVTPRLGLYRWSGDDDQIIRSQIDESHGSIEAYGAKILSGSSLPTVGSTTYARTFFLNTSDKKLYYYTSEDPFGVWKGINTDTILVTLAESKGDVLISVGPDEWAILSVGSFGQILTVSDDSQNIVWATIIVSKGDLLTFDGSSLTNFSVGVNGQLLIADSAQGSGLNWSFVEPRSISSGAATSLKFQSSSVTEQKFAVGSVSSEKIATGSVVSAKIQDGSVVESKIASLAVVTSKIANSAITEIKIGDDSVTSVKFVPSSVTQPKIFNLSVGSIELADGSVASQKLQNSSVTSAKIANGNVVNASLAFHSVTTNKLSDNSVTSAKFLDQSVDGGKIEDSSIIAQNISDSAASNRTIASASVTSQKIANNSITEPKIVASSVTSTKLGQSVVTSDKIADLSVTTEKIITNTVSSLNIRQSQVLSVMGNPGSNIQNVSDIAAASDRAVLQRVSGSLSFSPLASNSISDNAITTQKISDLTILNSDISSSANIALSKLSNGTLPSYIKTVKSNYVDNSVLTSKLSSSLTAEGVGVWLDYVPIVRRIQPNVTANPDVLLNPSDYIIVYAKYCKINEVVLARGRVVLSGTISESNGSSIAIGLPFVPAIETLSCIGSGYLLNIDTILDDYSPVLGNYPSRVESMVHAMNYNLTNTVVFGIGQTSTSETHNLIQDHGRVGKTVIEKYDSISFNVQYPAAL